MDDSEEILRQQYGPQPSPLEQYGTHGATQFGPFGKLAVDPRKLADLASGAWGMVSAPFRAAADITKNYRPGPENEVVNQDIGRQAFDAGSVIMGGAPMVEKGAVGSMGGKLPQQLTKAEYEAQFGPTVYHGAPDTRGIYKDGFKTKYQQLNGPDYKGANVYFFADEPRLAKTYADDMRAFDYQNAEPGVVPARLRMTNPMEMDWGGRPFRVNPDPTSLRGETIHEHINAARVAGHDGFIIHNVIDTYNGKGRPGTIRGVFDASRIRHPDAAFDPAMADSTNIFYSGGDGKAAGAVAAKDVLEQNYRAEFDPTRYYHGTASDFPGFDKSKFGSATGAKSAGQAAWLVSDPRTAGGYARYAAEDAPVRKLMEQADTYERLAQKTGKEQWWDKQNDAIVRAEALEKQIRDEGAPGQRIIPAHVRGKYAEHDMGGAEFTDVDKDIQRHLRDAKAAGLEGVKFHNLADDIGVNGRPATHVAVFEPQNMRSPWAAYDPAKRDSTNLLAAGGNRKAAAGVAAKDILEEQYGAGAPKPELPMTAHNEGLSYLLGPPSKVGVIGAETGKLKPNGVSVLKVKGAPEGYGSSRIVYTKDGQIVGAMQVTSTPNGLPQVANTYVAPEFRRTGIASELNKHAEDTFGKLERSDGPSGAGQAFRDSLKP